MWLSINILEKKIYRSCFVLLCIWGNFPSTSPRRAYIWRGDLTEGFCVTGLGGLIYFKGHFWGAYFWRGLCTKGNLRLKIHWASLLLCFTLYLTEISKYKPPGGLYLDGRFNGGFFALRLWGAYIWRGLFSESYGIWTGLPTEELIFGILRYFLLDYMDSLSK